MKTELDLSSCESSDEIAILVSKRVSEVTCEWVIDQLPQFVFMQDTIEAIYVSLLTQTNCILYGPGGFGKSDITKAFCELLGIPYNTILGYESMTVEELIGIPDMKKLLDDSEYLLAFENSIFNKKGVLIMEECLDIPPNTLASLKDIISEGGYRDKRGLHKSFASSIISIGNADPKNLAVNMSTTAFFMERFPIQCKVCWQEYSKFHYTMLFDAKFPNDDKTTKNVIASICGFSSSISPRIALSAYKVGKVKLSYMSLINGMDTSRLKTTLMYMVDEDDIDHQKMVLTTAEQLMTSYDKTKDSPLDPLIECLNSVSSTFHESMVDARDRVITRCKTMIYEHNKTTKLKD